jgi:hypothetical protein
MGPQQVIIQGDALEIVHAFVEWKVAIRIREMLKAQHAPNKDLTSFFKC